MNLLPPTEKEGLKKGLKTRFLIAASFLVSGVFLVGFALILPSYFLSLGNVSKTGRESLSLNERNDDASREISGLPKEIDMKLRFLRSNMAEVSVFNSLEEVVSLLPEGVKIDSVLFFRNQVRNEKNGSAISLSGVATTRDSLVSFSNLLKGSASFSVVDTPVSSLAKDRNLPFSINIFIENRK